MNFKFITVVTCFIFIYACNSNMDNPTCQLPLLKPDHETGFSHGGWNLDRYPDIKPLDAGKSIVIADLKGPGIITHIHTTRHHPEELMSRGIVLIIYFDDADEPSVFCPLADFFGDGSNGKSMGFSSNLIECAPYSYNVYIPMPFKKRAKVILRNDTERNTTNYSYVEWEKTPEWDNKFGYFHATYKRELFQLGVDTDKEFFKVEGMGHLIGRQFSISTDDPIFKKNFDFIMEGNNEINIDGKDRVIDYLGTEDSFTFSWGWQKTFVGQHAGITLREVGDTSYLSVYRFHDHMPIRFNRDLEWRINWKYEINNRTRNEVKDKERVKKGECHVDYATVFYWYQNDPGGFVFEPLAPVQDRKKRFIKKDDNL